MSVTQHYREAWEGFWREAPQEPGSVLWDAEPDVTAAAHVPLFTPHLLDPGLPLIDLGCGNGTQTRFLATRFTRVLGVDLAEAALEHARRADPEGRAEYRFLDAVDRDAAERLHDELGDANVYMRGLLHQCGPEDRGPLTEAVAALLGARGRVFLVEPSEEAGAILGGLARRPEGPPPKVAPIFRHGIAPGAVSDAAVPGHLTSAGLTVLALGQAPLTTTEHTADGALIVLPSRWAVAGRTA
ncbi:class I SAM-dependent methyltransferase [Streptomyces roseirectus]|uniref:Class I SAM-dependent methyltransferase n=1 Tax=Streptomyces roseirectus TaxID=2768066 RepID=A0A7H0I907_9ACTN|nr:class I SAM-dependent methyltransferase [Streptomyces roseirectus]QNP69273.1 class I SAM-dependent methyltransferase [Streptomyces roseirectus]